MRDGTVVGRLTAISVDFVGTIGEKFFLEERNNNVKDTPVSPQEPLESQPLEGQLFEAPSSEAVTPERRVWEHWLKATGTRQKLDATRRGVIRNALKLRTAEQCCMAIDGLMSDPWWRENRPRMELRYALRGNHAKGQSDEDRIDDMIEKSKTAPNPEGGTVLEMASDIKSKHGKVTADMLLDDIESVQAWLRNHDHPGLKSVGERSRARLRASGYELVIDNPIVTGYRKVAE